MRRRSRSLRVSRVLLAAAVVGLAACGQESPTSLGGGVVPGGVRSFEVVLDPDRFLLGDTTFRGYSRPQNAPWLLVADAFEGIFDANVITRIQLPFSIVVEDAGGAPVVDTQPIYGAGSLTLRIDTARSHGGETVSLELYRLAENFHRPSVTWTERVDTLGENLPWTEPGGTRGQFIGDANWVPGSDSVIIDIDPATLQLWWDTASAVRGAVLVATGPGSRIRITDYSLTTEATSLIDPDTVVVAVTRPVAGAFVSDPPAPPPDEGLFVGGNPAWRAFLSFAPGLDTVTVPCPGNDPPGCRVRLGNAGVSHAGLLFEPIAPPMGFVPEDTVRIGAREALVTPALPLERSPLGAVAGVLSRGLAPERFVGGGEPFEIPITTYFAQLAADSVDRRPEPHLGVAAAAEGGQIGIAAFAGLPRLRLILTITSGF